MRHTSADNKRQHSRGFTLIEMLIIAPVVLLTIGAFIALMVSMVGTVMISRSRNTMVYDIQDTLSRIEQDTHMTAQFQSSSGSIATPQGLNDGSGAFTSANALVLNSFATDKNPEDTSRQLIYYANQPNACGSKQNLNRVFLIKNIYYLKNGSLWRRTVLPTYDNNATPDANTICGTPWQRNSCSPGYTAVPPCQTNDIEVLKNVASFNVTYYASLGDTTSLTPDQAEQASAITIAITSTETAAGKSISESGSIVVAKANGANTQAPPIATPTVTSQLTDPNTVTFTWDKSPTATQYLLSYSINGGSWTNTTASSTTSTYPVTANRGDTITFKVAAQNSTETSPYATITTTIPIWTSFSLQNGWVDYGNTYAVHAYTRTAQGVVMLKGLIMGGANGTLIGTLPVGYRPSARLLFGTGTNPDVSSRIDILPTGEIYSQGTDPGWLSLDGINFMPSGTTWTDLPLYNSWTNWGAPYANIQASPIDASGRAHVQGLGRQGVFTDNTQIAQLPTGYQTSEYYHMPGRGAGFNLVGLTTTGAIVAKGVDGNTYSTTQLMYYPSGQGTWANLSLQNGWIGFGAPYTAPQYTKGSDGIVTVKGLIKSGNSGVDTVIAVLPVGYRPKERLLLTSPSNAAYGRFDVLPNGEIHIMTGSNIWASLDGITFRAEQ